MNRRVLIFLLSGIFIGLLGAQWFFGLTPATNTPPAEKGIEESKADHPAETNKDVPAAAYEVLTYVDSHHAAKPGYTGGRQFMNFEGKLPIKDIEGHKIRYREWDIKPGIKGVNRGPLRLVTGSDGSAWFTRDHYQNFIQIR